MEELIGTNAWTSISEEDIRCFFRDSFREGTVSLNYHRRKRDGKIVSVKCYAMASEGFIFFQEIPEIVEDFEILFEGCNVQVVDIAQRLFSLRPVLENDIKCLNYVYEDLLAIQMTSKEIRLQKLFQNIVQSAIMHKERSINGKLQVNLPNEDSWVIFTNEIRWLSALDSLFSKIFQESNTRCFFKLQQKQDRKFELLITASNKLPTDRDICILSLKNLVRNYHGGTLKFITSQQVLLIFLVK